MFELYNEHLLYLFSIYFLLNLLLNRVWSMFDYFFKLEVCNKFKLKRKRLKLMFNVNKIHLCCSCVEN